MNTLVGSFAYLEIKKVNRHNEHETPRKESESRLSFLLRKNMTLRGMLAIAAGCWLLFIFTEDAIQAYKSLNWPTTQGTVIRSEASRCTQRHAPDGYQADIIYAYSVNGVSYSSNRIVFAKDLFFKCSSYPEKLLMEFPYGKLVLVYYDPSKPSSAVLKPGGISNFWSIGVLLALIFLGIFNLLRDNKRKPFKHR